MEGLDIIILTGLHGGEMMMELNATLSGHTVPTHSYKHEQVGMVYRGKAKLRIGNEKLIVVKGDFYCIPSNTPHSDTCLSKEPFIMLDIFYPVREDFLQKLETKEKNPK
ncbi:MAG: cupin domain-containing protein [Candidatus Hermodarchaeota archaeon]